jgi:hypothetical protein
MKNPLLNRVGSASREVRKRFLMMPLARTQSQRQHALPDRRQRSKTLDIFFPGIGNPGKASNNDIQVFSLATFLCD